jgi:hypothetical protein
MSTAATSTNDAGPAQDHAPVVPSDSTTYAPPFRRLFVGGAGAVVVTSRFGVDASYTCPAGTLLDVSGTKVKATGTTATLIVAQY